jgi:uncharacterized protein
MDKEKQNVMDNYAIVTGAGAGLGFAFATEMATKGYNIILVSLPGEDLENKATVMTDKYKVKVRFFETDLSQEANCISLHEWVVHQGLKVSVLINNAGIGSTNPFLDFKPGFYTKQILVNIMAPVLLCRLFIPTMIESGTKAYILNVGSLGGFFHIPNKEVYGATKAFIHSFTNSLQLKLEDTQISMMVVCPGPVETNDRLKDAHKNMKGLAKKAVMHPHEVAAKAVDSLFKGKKILVPGRINNLFLALDWVVPNFIKNRILRKEMIRQASFSR